MNTNFTVDFDGTTRDTFDIGAYEYGEEPSSPGATIDWIPVMMIFQ